MSNLIITIISIALIAIAAITSVYYVGPAFENAQARGYAVAIAEQAVQINNAITQWQLDNNAGFLTAIHQQIIAPSCYGNNINASAAYICPPSTNPIANVLTPNWLQNLTPPDTADFNGIYNRYGWNPATRWELSGSDSYGSLQAGVSATYGWFIFLFASQPVTSTAVQVCNQIAIMARGPNAVPVQASTGSWAAYVAGENPVLDCMWFRTGGGSPNTLSGCIGTGSESCGVIISSQVNASW